MRKRYSAAYDGSGLNGDEIWEEVVCDSLGDMNIFREYSAGNNVGSFLNGIKKSSEVGQTVKELPDKSIYTVSKMSVELDDLKYNIHKESGIMWNGGSTIKLSKSEYAAVVSRISTRYYYANTGHTGVQLVDRTTDGKNAKHYVYLYTDHGFGAYQIIGRLTYGRNDELIGFLREEITNDRAAERIPESTDRLRDFYECTDSGGVSNYDRTTYAGNEQTDSGRREGWTESGRWPSRADIGQHDDGGDAGEVSGKFSRERPATNASEPYSKMEGLVQVEMLRQVEALKAQYRKLQEDEELEKAFLQGFNMEA